MSEPIQTGSDVSVTITPSDDDALYSVSYILNSTGVGTPTTLGSYKGTQTLTINGVTTKDDILVINAEYDDDNSVSAEQRYTIQ